jgi:hypothetical protein
MNKICAMMSLQQKIAKIVVDQTRSSGSPQWGLLDGRTTQEVCYLLFSSYRGEGTTAKGLRLSDTGLQLMRACFKSYEIQLAYETKLKLPHILYMERVTKMPYWMNHKICVLFDSELAMMLRLVEGRIQDLIDTRFRLTAIDNSLNTDE